MRFGGQVLGDALETRPGQLTPLSHNFLCLPGGQGNEGVRLEPQQLGLLLGVDVAGVRVHGLGECEVGAEAGGVALFHAEVGSHRPAVARQALDVEHVHPEGDVALYAEN